MMMEWECFSTGCLHLGHSEKTGWRIGHPSRPRGRRPRELGGSLNTSCITFQVAGAGAPTTVTWSPTTGAEGLCLPLRHPLLGLIEAADGPGRQGIDAFLQVPRIHEQPPIEDVFEDLEEPELLLRQLDRFPLVIGRLHAQHVEIPRAAVRTVLLEEAPIVLPRLEPLRHESKSPFRPTNATD